MAIEPRRAPVGSARYLPVALVGGLARRALTAGLTWRVVAVFRRSFYCSGSSGALVLVGPESLGAGPLHALSPVSEEAGRVLAGLRVGTSVGIDIDGASPNADALLTLGLRDAREWRPPARPSWEGPRLRRSLAWLEDAAERAPAEGVGRLIPLLAGRAGSLTGAAGASDLTGLAWPAVAALSGWVRDALLGSHATGAPPVAVDRLVGLGPGLTPSGDDVLSGALLALHAFSRAEVADALAVWLRPRAEGRTGAVSLAHLACAAVGEGAAVLHDALAALSSGDTRALDAAATAVGSVGHSSGWDALTGIVAVAGAWLAAVEDARALEAPCR